MTTYRTHNTTFVEDTKYVDSNTPVPIYAQDGSFARPYSMIQAAVDSSPVRGYVYVRPGLYEENVVLTKDILLLGPHSPKRSDNDLAMIKPVSGVPLTVTNATLESLAAYDISGNYADLVNNGPGVEEVLIRDIRIHTGGVSNLGFQVLGVKGDDTSSTTMFGSITAQVSVFGKIFAKNCLSLLLRDSYYSSVVYNNVLAPFVSEGGCFGDIEVDYTAGHADGEHAWGQAGIDLRDTSMQNLRLTGSAKAHPTYSSRGVTIFENLDPNDTADVEFWQSFIHGDVLGEADTTIRLKDTYVQGNINLDNGSGACTMDGGRYMGSLTDPNSRLARNLGS